MKNILIIFILLIGTFVQGQELDTTNFELILNDQFDYSSREDMKPTWVLDDEQVMTVNWNG